MPVTRRSKTAFPLLALLVLPGSKARAVEATPPGPDWEEANRTPSLVIFTRENEQVGARDIVAVGELEAPPAVVFGILADYDRYPAFMPYTTETRTLRRTSATRFTVYQRLSLPLVDDRDYAIDVTLIPAPDADGATRISWTAVPDAVPPRAGSVRVMINNGSWELRPLAGGKRTRLTQRLQTHPGGSIPGWIADRSNTLALPALFEAVAARSAARAATLK